MRVCGGVGGGGGGGGGGGELERRGRPVSYLRYSHHDICLQHSRDTSKSGEGDVTNEATKRIKR